MLLSMMAISWQCKESKSALDVLDLASAYQLVYGADKKGRTIVVDKPVGGNVS